MAYHGLWEETARDQPSRPDAPEIVWILVDKSGLDNPDQLDFVGLLYRVRRVIAKN